MVRSAHLTPAAVDITAVNEFSPNFGNKQFGCQITRIIKATHHVLTFDFRYKHPSHFQAGSPCLIANSAKVSWCVKAPLRILWKLSRDVVDSSMCWCSVVGLVRADHLAPRITLDLPAHTPHNWNIRSTFWNITGTSTKMVNNTPLKQDLKYQPRL